MSDKDKLEKLTELKGPDYIHMQADVIDQLNTNNQSNMTLSAYSLINQSCSTIKISGNSEIGGEAFEQQLDNNKESV